MINRIEIEGFKSIKRVEIEFKPINVLIGTNGVGKSNFISFFHLLNMIYQKKLENYSLRKGADKLLHFGIKHTSSLSFNIGFNKTNAYKAVLEPGDNNQLILSSESVGFYKPKNRLSLIYGSGWSWKELGKNLKESILSESNREYHIQRYVNNNMNSFKIHHFHDTSNSSALRTPCLVNDNKILKNDGGNLAAFLYLLKEKENKYFQIIESIINSVAPYFGKFELKPDRLNEERINLEWSELNHPEVLFNAKHLSDGTLRFMALTTLLMQPSPPPIIIIDEPELGLHPIAIHKLAGMIQSVSKNCQVIVSTQSVNLVSQFNPDDVLTVDREGSQTVFSRLDKEILEDWLSDFTLGELWEKNIIKGQPY